MNIKTEYQRKLCTAQAAASIVQSGDWVDFGYCAMMPEAIDEALAERLPQLEDVKLRGGILLRWPKIFDIENPERHLAWHTTHATGVDRRAFAGGFAYYLPLRYSELPRYYRDTYEVDVAILLVSPMDAHGYFNFGTSASHLIALCERAKTIIVEVNEQVPYCHGTENCIHISQIDRIVEGHNPPIRELPPPVITEVDRKVASIIVDRIPNGACLQIGIGGMPAAVGSLITQTDLKDLGVHSEMYVDAFVDIAEAGKINGSKKNLDRFRQTYTFAAGTRRMYEYLDQNPSCMTAAVDYVNDIRVIAALDNFTSINNAVNVDLFGQVSSETSGLRHISGAGGQLDFVLGAYLSKGGQSFICCSSTYQDKNGGLHSRLVPTLSDGTVVTDTRANIHYLVTEYGIANLKGLPTWQKTEAIISLAHPDFRQELIAQAEQMKIWRRSNRR